MAFVSSMLLLANLSVGSPGTQLSLPPLSSGPVLKMDPTFEVVNVRILVCREREAAQQHYQAIVRSRTSLEVAKRLDAATRGRTCYLRLHPTTNKGIIACSRKVDADDCAGIAIQGSAEEKNRTYYISIFPKRH